MIQGHLDPRGYREVAAALVIALAAIGRIALAAGAAASPGGTAARADVGGRPAVELGAGGFASLPTTSGARFVQVRLVVQHLSGDGPLRLGVAPRHTWPVARAPADGREHTVELRVVKPAASEVVLNGTGEDRWRVAAVDVRRFSPPRPMRLWDEAVYPAPLAADWAPRGLLDARPVTVADGQLLSVDVGAIRLLLPVSARGVRGLRNEFKAQALNQASAAVKLTIRLDGPPWFGLPESQVPIRGGEQIVLRPQFCSFWAGEHWARLVFETKGSQGAVPLRVECTPSYPAFGYFVPPHAAASPGVFVAPVSVVVAPARSVASAKLQQAGPEIIPYGAAEELVALRGRLSGGRVRIACLWGEAGSWREGLARVERAQAAAPPEARWAVAVGPLRPRVTDAGLALSDDELASLRSLAGRVAAVVAVAPSPPRIVAVGCRVDGAAVADFSRALDRAFDPSPMRQQLTEAGLSVPIAWVVEAADDVGPEVWLRVAASLLYQGATAMAVTPGKVLWPPMWVDAMRELSAAVPVVPLAKSDFASTRPTSTVVFKPFVRGREGCLALWNSSGRKVEVAIEPRIEPMEGNMVAAAPGQPPLRTHVMPFKFQEDAFEVGRPLIVLTLQPGEARVVNLRFVGRYTEWLRSVEKMRRQRRAGPPEDIIPRYDDWWQKLRRRARPRH